VCAQTLIGHNSTVWSLAFGPPPNNNNNNDDDEDSSQPSSKPEQQRQESIVSVSDDTSVVLWQQSALAAEGGSASGWACTHRVSRAHARAVYSVDWCSYGHEAVATGGADNALRLWQCHSTSQQPQQQPPQAQKDTGTGQQQQQLVLDVEVPGAHEGDVNSVSWAPRAATETGKKSWNILATGGDDGLVKLWRYSSVGSS
jgi:WD40 repeat protein